MPNLNYLKGYRFQNRVKEYGESKGYYVMANPKSSFPDQIWMKPDTTPIFVECKVKTGIRLDKVKIQRFLKEEEIIKAKELIKKGFRFIVAFKNRNRGDIWFFENERVSSNVSHDKIKVII